MPDAVAGICVHTNPSCRARLAGTRIAARVGPAILLKISELTRATARQAPMKATRSDRRRMRRQFLVALGAELQVVWPILSALILIMLALGTAVGMIEGWPLRDSLYFALVTGLTIGYGDLV